MKAVDEYIQVNYSDYCDLLVLGFAFVNEKRSVYYGTVLNSCYSCDFNFNIEYLKPKTHLYL